MDIISTLNNPIYETLTQAVVRQAHGPERSRRTHHPEQCRRGVQFESTWMPACGAVSQLKKLDRLLFRHSGLDPESSSFSSCYVSGCRIKSGMTDRK